MLRGIWVSGVLLISQILDGITASVFQDNSIDPAVSSLYPQTDSLVPLGDVYLRLLYDTRLVVVVVFHLFNDVRVYYP